jgi:hypothetical protein
MKLLITQFSPTSHHFISLRTKYSQHPVFKCKIISRAAMIQVYKTLIRPVAAYGVETWPLTVTEENAVRMFERKIIRRIYGPVTENIVWRIRYTEELNTLLKGKDIVRFVKSQRIRWLGMLKEWKIMQCRREC